MDRRRSLTAPGLILGKHSGGKLTTPVNEVSLERLEMSVAQVTGIHPRKQRKEIGA